MERRVFRQPVEFAGGRLATQKTITASATLTADDSGKTIIFGAAGALVLTLPALLAGLWFKVMTGVAPSGATHTVVTASAANNMVGAVHSSTGGDADSETSGCDTLTFADGAAVKGDSAILECDGTNWFVRAFCNADTGITFDTAA